MCAEVISLRTNYVNLLFHDLQNFHGAGFDTDAAGDALGSGLAVICLDQDMEGADLLAFAAAHAELLVDHVDALCVLRDGAVLTDGGTLAALHADHRLGCALKIHDLDAGLIRIKLLIKCVGTGANALQTGHAGRTLLDRKFLHGNSPFCQITVIIHGLSA